MESRNTERQEQMALHSPTVADSICDTMIEVLPPSVSIACDHSTASWTPITLPYWHDAAAPSDLFEAERLFRKEAKIALKGSVQAAAETGNASKQYVPPRVLHRLKQQRACTIQKAAVAKRASREAAVAAESQRKRAAAVAASQRLLDQRYKVYPMFGESLPL